MTAGLAIATMVGAAMFPLFIRLVWGELVEDFGQLAVGWQQPSLSERSGQLITV